MTALLVELLVVLVLFVANGLFSMGEMAVISSRKSRLRQLVAEGVRGARTALRLAESPDRFLPTVQIGITAVGLLAGAFSGITLAEQIAAALQPVPALAPYAEVIGVAAVVLALTFLSLVLGELAPKRIALAAPEKIACLLARPIDRLARVATPATHVLTAATGLLLRMLRVKPAPPAGVTEEEVRLLVREGSESGVFHKDEPRMVESVLAFDRLPIQEIMTPRGKLVGLQLSDTSERLWHKIVRSGHSAYPVFDEVRERIVGMVTVKAMYANLAAGARASVADLLTQPLFVSPQEPVTAVLDRFKRAGVHFAVVREADGRALGIVTLVDVLEAVVGDIPSIEERLRPEARQRPDGSWLVDGQYDMAKLAAQLPALAQPEGNGAVSSTLAQFVSDRLAGAPREGNYFVSGGLRFEIVDMDRTSVDKVLIAPSTEKTLDGEKAATPFSTGTEAEAGI